MGGRWGALTGNMDGICRKEAGSSCPAGELAEAARGSAAGEECRDECRSLCTICCRVSGYAGSFYFLTGFDF